MRTVAVYNMKGGVGKTTAAVNLSYLAAEAGQRTLLWDLDPQAAATFALRVRARVAGFDKGSVSDSRTLGAAIKETDYDNLFLLPADFAYRKFERFLDSAGKPEDLVASLLAELGREFDMVFLDCPAGFSLLIEGLFAAVDMILVPVIPTVLSLRTLVRLVKWADRSDAPAKLTAFLSMVDRRRTLHRRASELVEAHPTIFLSGQIPYASAVEQMSVRRMPLPVFAARDAAASAFAAIWIELRTRLCQSLESDQERVQWAPVLRSVESLVQQLDSLAAREADIIDPRGGATFVHSFDTAERDLAQRGYVLELRECAGRLLLAAAPSDPAVDPSSRAQVQVDGSWAVQILSGERSPLATLQARLNGPALRAVDEMAAIVGSRRLGRVSSRAATGPTDDNPFPHVALSPTSMRPSVVSDTALSHRLAAQRPVTIPSNSVR